MASLVDVPESTVTELGRRLLAPGTGLPEKYRVLFSLRNAAGAKARSALLSALKDSSALFRHDVAFCLGQRQETESIGVLTEVLNDPSEHPMVRHEAAEALGAIGTVECVEPIRHHLHDPVLEVAETCQLALQRIRHLEAGGSDNSGDNPYLSVDPAPSLPLTTCWEDLALILLDDDRPMFERYSALFAIRNKGGPEAVEVLGRVFSSRSALLKHEVAYVLGQMQDAQAVEVLLHVLQDGAEHAMVRHEAAEALGAIASERCEALLRQHLMDPEPIVAHSCEVALDVLRYERSGQFQYAAVA